MFISYYTFMLMMYIEKLIHTIVYIWKEIWSNISMFDLEIKKFKVNIIFYLHFPICNLHLWWRLRVLLVNNNSIVRSANDYSCAFCCWNEKCTFLFMNKITFRSFQDHKYIPFPRFRPKMTIIFASLGNKRL